jgi:hypothetical protein
MYEDPKTITALQKQYKGKKINQFSGLHQRSENYAQQAKFHSTFVWL